jgi:HlyD family secretion protein
MKKRFILPAIGILAALWATFSIARTTPYRERTEPPAAPPASPFVDRVAAVGLIEASTENVAVGTPLSGVVMKIFVGAGQTVRRRQPLFQLDTRHLEADLDLRQHAVSVTRARRSVAAARLDDLRQQLGFAERITDKRAISAEELSRRRSAVETALAELAQADSEIEAAESEVRSVQTEIDRSTIRAPIDAVVLQVRLRAGEFAPAAATGSPLIVLGRLTPLHVRVDIDEHEAWRVRADASAVGQLRGNADLRTPLAFVRFEPFVIPKRSLTGDSTERVDTRVLQVIYRIDREDLPLYVGQQMDVFIDGSGDRTAAARESGVSGR